MIVVGKKGVNMKANKRAQITIFIIIAIMIVGVTAGFFIFRGKIFQESGIPTSMEPVYNTFLNCIEGDARVGISILESQGGYIELPVFEAGSNHMPFSSHLNFLGNPIPYWYYVAGNGIQKEQVPTKSVMEQELAAYVQQEVRDCIFEQYVEDGFDINMGEPEVEVSINSEDVVVDIKMALSIERANETASVANHKVIVNSKLGKLYETAREVYDYEQQTLFLENYGVDTLRLYAPVDGAELSCSPLIWNADEIFDDLEVAIEANVQALRVRSGDFELSVAENKYFIVDIPIEGNVRFLNSRNWPNAFEVNPSEGAMLIVQPTGSNPGMAAMGFCYVAYHFVYDVKYPVLIQVYEDDEIFQFPVAVVIAGNKPRKPVEGAMAYDIPNSGMCDYKDSNWGIYTFDTKLNPVSADISFKCFNEICNIGETSSDIGYLEEVIPRCVNGYLLARAEGYEDQTYHITSSADEGIADLLMKKIYPTQVQLKLDNSIYNREAIITFESEGISRTIAYPIQKSVDLSAGNWTVRVYMYRNTSITIPETSQEQCIDAPSSGVGGLFGITEKQCFDITIPAQTIDSVVSGGGEQVYYILDEELASSSIIDINAGSLPTPRNIEDLQKNYDLLEDLGLDIDFS